MEIVSALLYGVLTNPESAQQLFQSISLVNRDQYAMLWNRLFPLVTTIKFTNLKQRTKDQVRKLFKKKQQSVYLQSCDTKLRLILFFYRWYGCPTSLPISMSRIWKVSICVYYDKSKVAISRLPIFGYVINYWGFWKHIGRGLTLTLVSWWRLYTPIFAWFRNIVIFNWQHYNKGKSGLLYRCFGKR